MNRFCEHGSLEPINSTITSIAVSGIQDIHLLSSVDDFGIERLKRPVVK